MDLMAAYDTDGSGSNEEVEQRRAQVCNDAINL
jgi:hypothetical protein